MKRFAFIFAGLIALAALSCAPKSHNASLESGDWPQYRADAGRTGYSPVSLPGNLSLKWQRETPEPDPAWQGVHTRMTFDYATQPVIGGSTLYFGSSRDCKIYAVDTETGNDRWTFFTDAPVRFAPALWQDRLFAVSDDGCLYCLDAQNGDLLWKKQGGPDSDMIIGNSRMISTHPARGGVVIRDNVLYFGAGIWPSEGIFIRALNPATGEEIWCNDDSGGLLYDQPHGGAVAKSGISSQGYLVSSEDRLFVPTGRSVPAALNTKTGALEYFHLQKHRTYGGSRIMAAGPLLFAASGNTRFDWEIIGERNAVFSVNDGELASSNDIDSPALAASPDFIFHVDSKNHHLKATPRASYISEITVKNRKGEAEKRKVIADASWEIDTREPLAISMIAAGDKVISASINGKVTMIDTVSKAVVWSAEVSGHPYGLAAAHGALYVTTDSGMLYCFDASGTKSPTAILPPIDNTPYVEHTVATDAAVEILATSGISEGYCLDLGCGDGALSFELARRTNLKIIAIDNDPQMVATARKKLDAAGLYGDRVTVHLGDPSKTSYSDYFANLIVSGRSLDSGPSSVTSSEAERLQRPHGGVICIGAPGAMKTSTRGALDGAGDWTHLYADPANTICSPDEIVKAPLSMLWFGDSDFEMPSRHGRGVGPLSKDGRMFVQGTHGIRAYDAYNGHVIWEYFIEDLQKDYDQEHLIGSASTHGNWCIEGERMYVRVSRRMASDTFRNVLVIDTATGVLVDRIRVPALPNGTQGYWGYIAVENGILFGTIVNDEHITKWGYLESDMSNLYSESKAIFALDAMSGELKWMYEAKNSIRHNAIAIGNGRVYIIDRSIYKDDHLFSGNGRGRGVQKKEITHRGGKLLAFNADSGKTIASVSRNIDGTLLALAKDENILIMTQQYTRFKLPSDVGGEMTGFDATSLKRLWDTKTGIGAGSGYGYSSRPMINTGTIYFEPHAFDVKTGTKLDFAMSRTYNCGIMTSARHLMMFRSGTMAYLDLDNPDAVTEDYGGIRPGCWINTIAAGGVVLMPDATARCNCSYLIKATIALKPSVDGL